MRIVACYDLAVAILHVWLRRLQVPNRAMAYSAGIALSICHWLFWEVLGSAACSGCSSPFVALRVRLDSKSSDKHQAFKGFAPINIMGYNMEELPRRS